MNIEIQHRPAYALAVVSLEAGESVVGEPGSMISMDGDIAIDTSAGMAGKGVIGGLLSGLKRMVAGESFLRNTFKASRRGTVCFAPTHVGDMEVVDLDGSRGIVLQAGAWVCAAPTVSIDASWGGARSFFAGEGLILLKVTGHGPMVFQTFGGVKAIDIDGEFVVDSGHIVAFEDSLAFTVGSVGGGIFAFLFGGEGLVATFKGRGRLWIQTRNATQFGQWIGTLLPMREG